MARQVTTITMLETRAGCPDGIHAQFFETGKTYTTTPTLAKMFLHNRWATVAGAEEKMADAAPQNKMAGVENEKVLDREVLSAGKIADEKQEEVKTKRTK